MKKIPLFVTLDAEGDNGWARPHTITTENSLGVDRFQLFCERYGVKPIYLTTYEMAQDKTYCKALKQKNLDGLCEIGMHMHGWSTPPNYNLTGDDFQNLPFITEYPESVIRDKVESITKLIEDVFELRPISHRSGRWIVNNDYLNILVENGYKIDCSFTPLINWGCSIGDPTQKGGSDYSQSNARPHKIQLQSGVITEVPMTTANNPLYNNFIVNTGLLFFNKKTRVYNAVNGRKTVMLRPDLRNERFLLSMIDSLCHNETLEHVEFMVHTSEIYPNTCPHCKSENDLDSIYSLMEKMFEKLNVFCESITFREYVKES